MKIIEETNWLLRNICETPLTIEHFDEDIINGLHFVLIEDELSYTLMSITRSEFYKYEFIRQQQANIPIVKKLNI